MFTLRQRIWIDAPAHVVWNCLHEPTLRLKWDQRLAGFEWIDAQGAQHGARARYSFRLFWPLRYSLVGRLIACDPPWRVAVRFRDIPRWTGIASAGGAWRLKEMLGGTKFHTAFTFSMRSGRVGRLIEHLTRRRLERLTAESLQHLRRMSEACAESVGAATPAPQLERPDSLGNGRGFVMPSLLELEKRFSRHFPID